MITEKRILMVSKVLSMLLTPFYLPLFGLILLFMFSYLSLLPTGYKWQVGVLVYIFTVLAPTLSIRLYRRSQGWTRIEMLRRERRIIPYVITILFYFVCFHLLRSLHVPHFIGTVVIAALFIQIVCALINVWWKISTHTAAVGAVGGGLIGFAFHLHFDPTLWLGVVFLLGGLVGSSRMLLKQHSLAQVVVGFFTGMLGSFIIVMIL